MSERHYWPEPKEGMVCQYLVQHKQGEVRLGSLDSNGTWSVGLFTDRTVEELERFGYLGVLKPFDEEAERAAFEARHKGCDFERFDTGNYANPLVSAMWTGWLAAKRHERGL